jgi:hypothetical protein
MDDERIDQFAADNQRWRDITGELDRLGKEMLSGAPLNGFSQSNNTYEARLSRYQAEYAKSPYFYTKEKAFFHLTSIPKLFSIITDRAFRFYDLNSSADSAEFHHAAEALGIPRPIRENKKSRVYSLSFCPISEIKNEYMWEAYGDKLGGAAIVFTLRDDQRKWVNFHMSEMYYEIPQAFFKHLDKMTALANSRKADVSIDWTRIVGFHKHQKYQAEKEVRILTVDPFDRWEQQRQYIRMDYRVEKGRNRMTYYFRLPIWINDERADLKRDYPDAFF